MGDDGLHGQRWVVVADSPFLPAHGGGEVEHLGFVRACHKAGVLAALVVPADHDSAAVGRDDDIPALRDLIHPAPLFLTPRRRNVRAAFAGRRPYPVASRPAPEGLARDVHVGAPDANAVIGFSYKSHGVTSSIAEALTLPAIMRMHNMEGRYFHALAGAKHGPRRWAGDLEASRIALDERRLERAPWVRGIADISRSDAIERQARTLTPVAYVPTFALGGKCLNMSPEWVRPDRHLVLFLGALDVPTNHDAVNWLCQAVWPLVLSRVPSATLRIAGRRPTTWVRSLVAATPRAEVIADLADPHEVMRQSAVAVNPAVSGSGVNIKLVEYLATGVPVVSTGLGAQGLELRSGRDLLIREDAPGFASAVCDLLTDQGLAESIGANGRRAARRLSDTHSSLNILADLIAGRVADSKAAAKVDAF